MSDYEDTVRYSLLKIDDEEILDRLKKNAFTDAAKVVAREVLADRGYKDVDGKLVNEELEAEKSSQVVEPSVKNGLASLLMVWGVKIMKPKVAKASDIRAEYHFDYSKAVRGKYYRRILKEGTNVVVLEPDIAKAFPNSDAVNDALRVVLEAGRAAGRLTLRSARVRGTRTRAVS